MKIWERITGKSGNDENGRLTISVEEVLAKNKVSPLDLIARNEHVS